MTIIIKKKPQMCRMFSRHWECIKIPSLEYNQRGGGSDSLKQTLKLITTIFLKQFPRVLSKAWLGVSQAAVQSPTLSLATCGALVSQFISPNLFNCKTRLLADVGYVR